MSQINLDLKKERISLKLPSVVYTSSSIHFTVMPEQDKSIYMGH